MDLGSERKLGVVLVTAAMLMLPQFASAQSVSIQTATLGQNQTTAEISTDQLRHILQDGSATVFDARPMMEFAAGHIPGAVNVSAKAGAPMSLYVSDVVEIERVVHGDKDRAIVLYCNGPFCGKSSRLADELVQAGFTNVRRYQLGAPIWRALGGVMQIEPEGVAYVRQGDHTVRLYDARAKADFVVGTLPGAINLQKEDVERAKDDGRLPMEDHNTRIVVFGSTVEQARATAETIAKNAFHNVMFCVATFCGQHATSE